MSKKREPILKIPKSVIDDALNYRGQVEKFLNNEMNPVSFRAYRVPMGVYEQRASGKFMVRIRIGAGLALPFQLEKIAQLSKRYGNGIIHVTTRQDIQIHEVKIEDTPDILEGLLEVGLSTRGGGGNTVRNVTACPEAGVCSKEVFDVAPYAIAATEYLLQDSGSFNLPRKYKIVFSGCSEDCAFASVADLGLFAHIKDGIKGFAVYAAGGLGSNPAVAIKIDDFIKEDEVFEVAEAIKKLFDKYGDRSNKHKARLRYVLARLGQEEFKRLYKEQRNILQTDGLPFNIPELRDIGSNYPAPKYSINVRLYLTNGDIPADDLVKAAKIAEQYGQGLVRTTQLQDLLITGVSPGHVNNVNEELKKLSINVFESGSPKVVACTGASTCKLGLCLSRGLSKAISKKLSDSNLNDKTIRISGCPNSCGHHYIADIGFQGKAKRVNGRLMPCYDILVGAQTIEGNANLAQRIGTVPAKKIPDLLDEAIKDGSVEKETLRNLVSKYSLFDKELSIPDDYYYDWDSEKPFSLEGRGPGECGAGVMDIIKLDIDEAKEAIKTKPLSNENIYKAITSGTRALLVKFGLEPKKDREIFIAFQQHLIEPGWFGPETQQILDNALDWKMGDLDSIEIMHEEVKDLVKRVEKLFLSLDANLEFKIEPLLQKKNIETEKSENRSIDLRGVKCPMNFVKAKLELEKIEKGDILEILLDDGEAAKNVPVSFAEQGQEVFDIKNIENYYSVKVRRKK